MDAILNWIWQGVVVAIVTTVVLAAIERSRAHDRYLTVWSALLAVLALPIVPYLWQAATGDVASPDIVARPAVWVSLPATWWTSSATAIALWAVWLAVSAARVGQSACALRIVKRAAARLPHVREARFTHWSTVAHTGRRASLVMTPAVRTAAVLGFGTPVIALEPTLLDELTDEQLDRLVIHEWAHVQRHDDRAQLLEYLITLVAGWHPAVWWLTRQMRIERELACDELVVAITRSPKDYASSLIRAAELRTVPASTIAALSVIGSSGLRRRITRILSSPSRRSPAWRAAAAAGGALVAALTLAVGGIRTIEAEAIAVVSRTASDALEAVERMDQPLHAAPSISVRAISVGAVPRTAVTTVALPRSTATPAIVTAGPGRPTRAAASMIAAPAAEHDAHERQLDAAHVPGAFDTALPGVLPRALTSGTDARSTTSVTPWQQAADGGAAIGRQSADAGRATAGYFNRLGKRIARSF